MEETLFSLLEKQHPQRQSSYYKKFSCASTRTGHPLPSATVSKNTVGFCGTITRRVLCRYIKAVWKSASFDLVVTYTSSISLFSCPHHLQTSFPFVLSPHLTIQEPHHFTYLHCLLLDHSKLHFMFSSSCLNTSVSSYCPDVTSTLYVCDTSLFTDYFIKLSYPEI